MRSWIASIDKRQLRLSIIREDIARQNIIPQKFIERRKEKETIFVKMTVWENWEKCRDRDFILVSIFLLFQKVQTIYNKIIRTENFIDKFKSFQNLEMWKNSDVPGRSARKPMMIVK